MFFAGGTRSIYGVFYVAQVQEFGWSRGAGSAAYAVNLLLMIAGTPIIGALLDRWGPRIVFGGSVLLTAAGLAAGVFVREAWHLVLAFGVIAGIGITGNAMPLHGTVLARWFARRRGLALGIATSGVGVAQAVMSPLAQRIISAWGWRAAYLVLAGATALAVPLVALLFRGEPGEVGQQIDGASSARVITARRRPGGGRSLEVRDAAWAETEWTLARAMRTGAFWWVMGVSLFQSYSLHVVGVHTVALLVDHAFAPGTAAALYGAMGIGMTAGLFFWGGLSDRIGREGAYTLGTLFFMAGLAVMGILTPEMGYAPAWAAVLILGMGAGSRPILFSLIAVDIFQGRHVGRIIGLAAAGFGIGGSLGSVTAGMIFDFTGSYAWALWLCEITLILSAISAWAARPGRIRRSVARASAPGRDPAIHSAFIR